MAFNNLFDKLAAAEDSFLTSTFLSPVMPAKPIRVRIAGVVVNLLITKPKNYGGWGCFKPLSYKTAKFVREATMKERQDYLNLFPALRLVVCSHYEDKWFGIPSNSGDTRFKITGMVPIRLANEIQMFETVITRFDGGNCWFDKIDPAQNMRSPSILREELAKMTDVSKLPATVITREERHAYAGALTREVEMRKDRKEDRIKGALTRAGAEYRSYVERDNTYTVEYVVDGESHHSVVNKDTLEVQSAGICLSGGDRSFDLQSLVHVIREGINKHKIHHVSLENDYDEDD